MSDNTAKNSSEDSATDAKERLKLVASSLPGLSTVEELIDSKLVSDAELLETIPRYLLQLGGKRMRPLLCLLLGRVCGLSKEAPPQDLIDVAAGIELIHMATLLHDDIIDNASLRRHEESPFKKFGLGNTLLSGDFLLVRAFSLCAHLDTAVIDATEQACIELTEGEILETALYTEAHSRDSSIRIARKKTAALFRLAAFTAAHIAKLPDQAVNHFAAFGEALGIAFQILDDILDVTSSEDLLGKPSGTDIRERKPSMVNIIWLESSSELAQKLRTEPAGDDELFVKQALLELKESPVINECRKLAVDFATQAKSELEAGLSFVEAPEPMLLGALHAFVDYTLERVL